VGAGFSAPVHNGPGAHPASYTVGTGSFLGVKRPGRGVDHPLPSSAEVKERVELYVLPSLWDFVTCYKLKFTFNFTDLQEICDSCDGANDIPADRTFCRPLHALCDMELMCFCNFPELLSASMSSGKGCIVLAGTSLCM